MIAALIKCAATSFIPSAQCKRSIIAKCHCLCDLIANAISHLFNYKWPIAMISNAVRMVQIERPAFYERADDLYRPLSSSNTNSDMQSIQMKRQSKQHYLADRQI